ncbi:MBOAT1 [Bugula neritina]|uniref:MBOAT1 n=1 Tax=Bugula neritina TaxID=10212 RepID=A0A7J7IZ19_BUGNE|nr:MBOAT1 [Bugula neritina]
MLSILQGIPSDQLTAMGCQLLSLMSGVLFYHVFHTKYSSTNTRHLISLTIGLTVAILCYKTSFIHLLLLCLLSYTVLLYVPVGFRGWLTFALCFGHVLLVHLDSYVNHYMEFRVEISNSLMVLASKVSYTAFSLDDNFKRSKLTPNQVKYKLTATPTFFEYFSYCFCFLGILFGPCYHFSEYMSFIRGDQYKEKWPAVSSTCYNYHFSVSY